MQKETLITIAERTGFSISTVSRVLNGKAQKYRIADQTVKTITEEARKCNYQPNLTAQSLRTKRTNTIGLMVPSIDNPFFANIANVIIHEARLYKYTVILIDSMENEKDEREGIDSLMSRNIDGIIIVPCGRDAHSLEEAATRTPIVLIDRYFPETTLPYVSTDNYLGSYNATRMLLESGHRKIRCIQGPPSSITTIERVRGYSEALQSYGIKRRRNGLGHRFLNPERVCRNQTGACRAGTPDGYLRPEQHNPARYAQSGRRGRTECSGRPVGHFVRQLHLPGFSVPGHYTGQSADRRDGHSGRKDPAAGPEEQ